MIRFIFGAPGSGKTHYVFDRLAEHCEGSFLIVPEQQTVVSERIALERLPATAQLNFEVLNFTRLANRVFRRYGGLSYHYVNDSMRSLLMWRTLRELSPLLEEYSQTGGELALTPVMLRAANELSASSVSPAELERAAARLNDCPLKRKLRDMSMICSAYRGLIDESFDDKYEDLDKLAALLGSHDFFGNSDVYIDSFTSFTAPEYKVIEAIFRQAKNVTVTLGCESPRTPLICTESICDTARRLNQLAEALGKRTESIYLTENRRAGNEELKRLTAELWLPGNGSANDVPEAERGNMKLIACIDPYDEAEAVASAVTSELMRGLRCRDIAVIARDVSRYEGIVDTALLRAGIPCFISKRNDVSSSPEIKLILSAIRIKYLGFRRTDVSSYLKTGLTGLSMHDIDKFEEYVGVWGISGERFTASEWSMNPDGYTAKLSERGSGILSAANRVRAAILEQLEPLFARMDAAEKVTDSLSAIYDLLIHLNVPEQIRIKSEELKRRGEKRRAADTLATWGLIINVLDDIAAAFPDERLDDEELYRAIVLCLENASVGAIPTGNDEVTVGSASLLRTGEIKTAILIGMNEGVFPATINDNGIFNDSDRKELAELGIPLMDQGLVNRASEELMYARRAMALPSEHLYMLYSRYGSDGKQLRPSMLVQRAKNTLPYLTVESFAVAAITDRITSPTAAAHLVTRFRADREFSQALTEELFNRGITVPDSEIAAPDCALDSSTVEMLLGKRITLSQAKLERFVGCGFAYYCDYALRLRVDERAEIDYRTSGTFIHSVLERFMRQAVTENGLELSDPAAIVDGIISEQIDKISTEEQRGSDRFRHLFERLRRLSLLMVESLRREFSASSFRPEYFELRIGDGGIDPYELKLADGTTVSFNGCIDRVDVWRKDGEVYLRVVDYKTGAKKFSLSEVSSGLNLQLLIYLFTLCRPNTDVARELGCRADQSPTPAAANYLSSYISPLTTTGIPEEQSVTEAALDRLDRSGIYLDDDEVLAALGASPRDGKLDREGFDNLKSELDRVITEIVTQLKSGYASALTRTENSSSPCDFCRMGIFCRNAHKSRR